MINLATTTTVKPLHFISTISVAGEARVESSVLTKEQALASSGYDGWLARSVHGWMGWWTDGWVGGWMEWWVGGLMGGWIGGWVDGWMDGWMDGRMDG